VTSSYHQKEGKRFQNKVSTNGSASSMRSEPRSPVLGDVNVPEREQQELLAAVVAHKAEVTSREPALPTVTAQVPVLADSAQA
jgi:hypothetical protein